jgi:hypothetical protein
MELIIRIFMILLSWTSLTFLNKKEIARFSPSAILVSLFLCIATLINSVFGLWEVKGSKKKQLLDDFSFIFGPFICATIWVLKLTFGRLSLYFLLNTVINFILAYPVTTFFENQSLYKLKKMKRHYLFLLCIFYSAMLYSYQVIIEKTFSNLFSSRDLDSHRFGDQSTEILKEKYVSE